MCLLRARHGLSRRGGRGPSSDKEGDPDVDATVRGDPSLRIYLPTAASFRLLSSSSSR